MKNDRYPLPPFRVHERGALREIIETYPLATLISGDASPDNITLVPMLVEATSDDRMSLVGHVDKNNPQASQLLPGASVSFVFQGPNAYASPDLYSDEQLPGWLYVMVKGQGTVSRLVEGRDAIEMLCDATSRFGGAEQSFVLESDDPRFNSYLHGISAFTIRIESLSGIAKLAQDKGPSHSELASGALNLASDEQLQALLKTLREVTR